MLYDISLSALCTKSCVLLIPDKLNHMGHFRSRLTRANNLFRDKAVDYTSRKRFILSFYCALYTHIYIYTYILFIISSGQLYSEMVIHFPEPSTVHVQLPIYFALRPFKISLIADLLTPACYPSENLIRAIYFSR